MKRYILILLTALICHSNTSNAQMVVENNDERSTSTNYWDGNVNIYKDQRLDVLVKKHIDIQKGLIRPGRGYRVQIYYGNDRAKAIQRKVDFMRRFPNVQVYMTYIQPQYRVKVGDFVTREEAVELYRQAISLYGACMIVPDKITVNKLRNDR